MSEYTVGFELNNMIAAPLGVATPKVIFKSEDGILLCYGTAKPTDADEGYAPGCIHIDTNGTTTATVLTVNIGTKASANFDVLTVS